MGESPRAAGLVPGDRVHTRTHDAGGHTRLPRYASGKIGTVVGSRGTWELPDEVVRTGSRDPGEVVCVEFDTAELWGDRAEPGHRTVRMDLWVSYLERA
jgi:nitrile hydratase subunit beta